jgi:hypothetical protein
MKQWVWVVCLALGIVLGAFIWSVWTDGKSDTLIIADDITQETEPDAPLIFDFSDDTLDNAEPVPIEQAVPELEKLEAYLDQADAFSEQDMAQLQQEADAIIQQADQLLADLALPDTTLTEAEIAEVEQLPEFQAVLKQEAELEARLNELDTGSN